MAKKGSEWAARIKGEVQKSIIGQDEVIERLLVALLSNGHVLLEGLPGLAKTLLIKSLGAAMGLEFERIQFTPDLLPSDVVGTMVFQPKEGSFRVHKGPVFANLVLADEINRAPAKVQSARWSRRGPIRYPRPRRTAFSSNCSLTIHPSRRNGP